MLMSFTGTDPEVHELPMNLADVERKLQEKAIQQTLLLVEQARFNTLKNREDSVIISKIPMEITQTIFSFCLSDITREDLLEANRSAMKSPTSPLLLGHICNIWRNIAWAMPKLWHRITLYMFPRNQTLQGAMVGEWLRRAANLPLAITVYSYASKAERHTRPSEGYDFPFIHVLNEYSHRWRSLYLKVPADSFPDYGKNQLDCHRSECMAPILEELVVEAFRVNATWPTSSYLNTPHLKTIALEKYLELKSIICSWGILTSFSMGEMTLRELRKVFSEAPNLTHCKISTLFPSLDRDEITTFVHHNLCCLEIQKDESEEGEAVASFLAHISLPHLEELSAHLSDCIDIYTSFIKRSVCTLRKMRVFFFRNVTLQSIITKLLGAIPSLEALYIHVRPDNVWLVEKIGSELLQLLSSSPGGEKTPLLPHLQDLELHGRIKFDWKVLCNFLESRCHTITMNPEDDSEAENSAFRTLRSVRVTVCDLELYPDLYLSDGEITSLETLIANGLLVRVEYLGEGDDFMGSLDVVDLIERSAAHSDPALYLRILFTDDDDVYPA